MQFINKRSFLTIALAVIVATSLNLEVQAQGLNSEPELPAGCEAIQVPAGNRISYHTYAIGVQTYRWTGTNWAFVAPTANLYASSKFRGLVGTHYAGPTWESNSGSSVIGFRLEGCTPDKSAIQWLLLGVVSSGGPGIFANTTYIQRVNTVGGLAPAEPGQVIGQQADVPYTTEYYFYKAK